MRNATVTPVICGIIDRLSASLRRADNEPYPHSVLPLDGTGTTPGETAGKLPRHLRKRMEKTAGGVTSRVTGIADSPTA